MIVYVTRESKGNEKPSHIVLLVVVIYVLYVVGHTYTLYTDNKFLLLFFLVVMARRSSIERKLSSLLPPLLLYLVFSFNMLLYCTTVKNGIELVFPTEVGSLLLSLFINDAQILNAAKKFRYGDILCDRKSKEKWWCNSFKKSIAHTTISNLFSNIFQIEHNV